MTRADWCWGILGLVVGMTCAFWIWQLLDATVPGPVHVPGADPTQVVPFVGSR